MNPKHFRIIRILMMLAFTVSMLFAVQVYAGDDDVKPKKVHRISKTSITVTAGKELELKVRTTPKNADDDYLRWKIVSGSKYVKFDDDDRSDDEIELKAVKAGTAKIRCYIKGTSKKVDFTVKVKAAPKKIKSVGKLNKTVEAGDDFELEVEKYSGLKDKYLKWSIKSTRIVRFDDDDRKGDEVEFEAKKVGKTTITCTNTKTKQKITYTITVIPDIDDDDWDDDDDRDDDDD